MANQRSTLKVATVCSSIFQDQDTAEKQHRFQFEFHPYNSHSRLRELNNDFQNCTFLLRLVSEGNFHYVQVNKETGTIKVRHFNSWIKTYVMDEICRGRNHPNCRNFTSPLLTKTAHYENLTSTDDIVDQVYEDLREQFPFARFRNNIKKKFHRKLTLFRFENMSVEECNELFHT